MSPAGQGGKKKKGLLRVHISVPLACDLCDALEGGGCDHGDGGWEIEVVLWWSSFGFNCCV